jgi:EmrB/QacA subfamily drug resistance transporter
MTVTIETSARPGISPRAVRPGLILTVLLAAQAMAMLDVNIVNVAAATIRSGLHASGAQLQLIIAGYLIAYAVLLITGARLGGALGFRRVFLGGLAVFTLASLACGLAPSAVPLIVFRFLQGAGAALMIPQVFSLIQRHFEGAARVKALGRYAAVIAAGSLAGQILGGLIVTADFLGTAWRPAFMINVPVGALTLFAAIRVLPSDTHKVVRRHDISGLVTLAVGVLALVVPLVFGHEEGWPVWCWALLAGALVVFPFFAFQQSRAAAPLMPARLFRAAGLLPAIVALFAMMASYAGYLFSVALHLQSGLGYSPLHAGLLFVPMAITFGTTSAQWRRLPARWHPYLPAVGLVVAAIALALIAVSLRGTPGIGFLAAQIPFGIGAGAAFAPLMARALANVAPPDAADASGLVTTIVQLAQVIGLSTVGSVYLSVTAAHGSASAIATTTAINASLALFGAAVSAVRRR